MRRLTRRTQPRPTGTTVISHTSAAAASDAEIQLSANYLATLQDSLHRAQVEQEIWANGVILAANAVRAERIEARREAQEEAHLRAELQRQEEQRIRDERLEEQRARAAEWREYQRQELERIRLEQEAIAQRRREERAAVEEAQRRAAHEAEEAQRRAAQAAEEAHQRAAQAAEEARQRAAQAAEEARQRAAAEAAEAERRRRERLRACTVCADDFDVDRIIQAPCRHLYCRTCTRDGFQTAIDSRTPFQCCQQNVPIALVANTLPDDFLARYDLMVLENNTPNPTYCANIRCGAFIPPANYHGPDSARCLRCGTDTCRLCRTSDHTGRGCVADQATEQVRALAAIRGWKACPSCGTMVEKNRGCQHMTCLPPCNYEFCWNCSGPWNVCRTRCAGP